MAGSFPRKRPFSTGSTRLQKWPGEGLQRLQDMFRMLMLVRREWDTDAWHRETTALQSWSILPDHALQDDFNLCLFKEKCLGDGGSIEPYRTFPKSSLDAKQKPCSGVNLSPGDRCMRMASFRRGFPMFSMGLSEDYGRIFPRNYGSSSLSAIWVVSFNFGAYPDSF